MQFLARHLQHMGSARDTSSWLCCPSPSQNRQLQAQTILSRRPVPPQRCHEPTGVISLTPLPGIPRDRAGTWQHPPSSRGRQRCHPAGLRWSILRSSCRRIWAAASGAHLAHTSRPSNPPHCPTQRLHSRSVPHRRPAQSLCAQLRQQLAQE